MVAKAISWDAEDLWWSSHLFCEWFNEFSFAEDIFWWLPWQTECSGCVLAWRLNTERRICTPLTIKWDAERHQNSAYWQLNSINSIFWDREEYKRKYIYVSLTITVIQTDFIQWTIIKCNFWLRVFSIFLLFFRFPLLTNTTFPTLLTFFFLFAWQFQVLS